MGKAMAIGGLIVAALLSLVFGLDLVAGVPFSRASVAMDVGMLVCSLTLAYLSWNAFRAVRG